MKKIFAYLLIAHLSILIFPEERKEIRLDPIEIYLSTIHNDLNFQNSLYKNQCLARKYVNFLIKQKVFGDIKVRNFDLLENEEYWLVGLKIKKKNNTELYECDEYDSSRYAVSFLMRKDNGEISHIVKY